MAAESPPLPPHGFIGVGIMGLGMAENLLVSSRTVGGPPPPFGSPPSPAQKNGRPLVVWNRTAAACDPLLAAYPALCTRVETAAEVVAACSITWSMLSTLEASEAVFPGVLDAVGPGKSIVDCATFTPERMQAMEAAVMAKGGRFIEGPVSGSKGPAAAGQLIFLCGGDESLFAEVAPELGYMGKASFNFGPVGAGTRMKLVV